MGCGLLLSAVNYGQMTKEQVVKGDVSLVTSKEKLAQLASFDNGNYKYSVEDFFAKPKARTFRLSPDGLRMSYFQKTDNGKNNVYVKEIKTGKVSLVIEEKEELIRGYFWLNNERLAYVMDKGGNENRHVYSAAIDGSAAFDLTPFDGVQAEITSVIKNQKDFIIVNNE